MVDVIKKLDESTVSEETQVNEINRDLEEKIQLLEEARDSLQEAYDNVQEAIEDINGQPATSIKAYFLDRLAIMISSDHGFLTNDPTIDSLIKDVREYYEDEPDESVKEEKQEKPKFEPGEKVVNAYGETLTVLKKEDNKIYVEEQPNKEYEPNGLVAFTTPEVIKDEDKS
jgi:hypothetical protein